MTEQTPTDTTDGADDQEQQQQDRAKTEERLDMDPPDMEETIEHEHDQKVDPGDASRYESAVDEALPGGNL